MKMMVTSSARFTRVEANQRTDAYYTETKMSYNVETNEKIFVDTHGHAFDGVSAIDEKVLRARRDVKSLASPRPLGVGKCL